MKAAALFLGPLLVLSSPSQGRAVSVTQTIEFQEIRGFLTFTDGTFASPAWNTTPFPFTSVDEIIEIIFDFSSTDPGFFVGVGPTGRDSGVEIGVIDDSGVRIGLSSVSVLVPDFTLFDTQLDPRRSFDLVAVLLLDGELTVSLGAFESDDIMSLPFTLGESSSLTLTVVGILIPEPSTVLLLYCAVGLLLVWRQCKPELPP